MWVKFTASYRHKPTPQVVIRYPAGATMNVPTPAGLAAIAKGSAAAVKSPRKKREERCPEPESVAESDN